MRNAAGYTQVQIAGSAKSRGTAWGKRARAHAAEATKWLHGYILDVGSNDGWASEIFKRKGFKTLGVDINPIRVVEALEHNMPTLCLDINKLWFLDGTLMVDCVFCSHTLEHLPKPQSALAQLGQITLYRMFIVVPIEPKDKVENDAHYFRFDSVEAFENIVPHGWRILKHWTTNRGEPEMVFVLEREY